MNKYIKNFIFSLIFVFSIFALCSCKSDDIEYKVTLNSGLKLEYVGGAIGDSRYNWYEVTAYDGNMPEVEIPSEYNGIKIGAIGNGAFSDREILYVNVPENVVVIESDAFRGSGIQTVYLPKSLEEIEMSAFRDCEYLDRVYYSGTITDWSQITMRGTRGYNGSPMEYANELYVMNESNERVKVTSVEIDEGTTSISTNAFYKFDVDYFILPTSITTIKMNAFEYVLDGNVFYKGSAQQLTQISIGAGNDYLNSNTYYYSENQPTEAGKYWHYDTESKIPVIWINE